MSHASHTWIQRLTRPLPRGGRPTRSTSHALRSKRPVLESLEDRALLAVNVLQSFSDINYNQTGISSQYTPPDTMMAVGPTTVVGAVNTALVLKDKAGNPLTPVEQFSTFFNSIRRSTDGFSDPCLIYDDQAGRYYVGIIEYPSIGMTGYLDFAVSNSNTPTGLNIGTGAGDWTVFSQISSVNENNTQFPDFPRMGWNNDAVFVSFNQFASGTTFSHDLVLAISKSSILAGGSLSTFQTNVGIGSDTRILIPARMHGSAAGTEYFVQKDSEGTVNGTVNVIAETGYLTASPSFVTTTISVNPYSASPDVPGLVTGNIDDRMLSADWVSNKLVAAQNAGVGGLNLARWYEFDTTATPALVPGQQGDISAGAGVSTSYPSIAINPSGDIGMTYIQSSSTQPYSMYVTGRLVSDPAGTMQPGFEVAAGVAPVPSAYRGGDYSATEYDPVNPAQFWSANEYNLDSAGSNFHWGTQIASYTLGTPPPPPPPADVSVTNSGPATGVEGGNLTYTLTVTNNDPTNTASNVVLTDTLGANLKFVSASGSYTQSGGVVTFSLGTMAPGQIVTMTVTAQATEDGSLTDTASVSSGNDPVPGNNSAPATTTVSEPPITPAVTTIGVSGKKVRNITVATFTHANGVEPASAFIASIDWGDGSKSTGTITQSGTTYTVKDTHTYGGKSGSHTVTTTVTEAGFTPNVAVPFGNAGGAAASLSGPSNSTNANPSDQVFVVPVTTEQQALDLLNNGAAASKKKKAAPGLV